MGECEGEAVLGVGACGFVLGREVWSRAATQTQPTSLESSDHNTPPSPPLSAPLFTNAQVRAKLGTKLRLEHLRIITDNYTLKEGDPWPLEFIIAQS